MNRMVFDLMTGFGLIWLVALIASNRLPIRLASVVRSRPGLLASLALLVVGYLGTHGKF
jgi:hypothetical protein